MRAARRDPRRGEKPMTAVKPQPVFVCCLWAHPALAPGSSVEQGHIEIKDEGQAFSGPENPPEGKCLHDRNYGGRQPGSRKDAAKRPYRKLPPSLCHENIKYEAQKHLLSQKGTHGSENCRHGRKDYGYRE